MNTVRIDIESQDIDLEDIAEQLVLNCAEEDMLMELARSSERIAKRSTDPTEKTFAGEAGVKLRELAEWFKENGV
jgi:hypothetical protein